MKKNLITMFLTFALLVPVHTAQAQDTELQLPTEMPAMVIPSEYTTGTVQSVEETQLAEKVTVQLDTPQTGGQPNIVEADYFGISGASQQDAKLHPGERVIVGIGEIQPGAPEQYVVVDRYRIPGVAIIAALFFAIAIFFGRKKGFMSIVGMVVTLLILAQGVVPAILEGKDPFWVSLAGAAVIALISLYIAHGFHRRTTVALGGTLITLTLAGVLSLLFVKLTALTGAGNEDAYFLQLSSYGQINLQGLLLGGIVIGVLGILDDITTAQAAAIEEIHKANPSLSARQLYASGLSIGREHIASLVNTLVLAYAGASLPLFILFSDGSAEPLWITMNHEFIVEEVVRTLVGSTALILAVPITTFLAARTFSRIQIQNKTKKSIIHHP